MSVVEGAYSQATLTFLDTDIGLPEYGIDTQGEFDHYDFTLPSQVTQTSQTQASQLTQHEQGVCVCVSSCITAACMESTALAYYIKQAQVMAKSW